MLEGFVGNLPDPDKGLVVDRKRAAEGVVQRNDEGEDKADRQHGEAGNPDVDLEAVRAVKVDESRHQHEAEDEHFPDSRGQVRLSGKETGAPRREEIVTRRTMSPLMAV